MDNVMHSLGYVGIGLLMFLETPIPSELIMPLRFTVGRARCSSPPVVAAG